jgi:cytochrome c oxidase subunit 2
MILAVWPLAGFALQSPAVTTAGTGALADAAWVPTLAACAAACVLVLVALAWALLRHRRGGRRAPGDHALGVTLALYVLLVGAGLAAFALARPDAVRAMPAPARAPLQVRITAHQWWWQVEYPTADPARPVVTANELHLPAGRPVRIELASVDSIHGLWIPLLSGRLDLVPGRTAVVMLTPRTPGSYFGRCATYCGLQHAHMALDVQVDDADGFAAWEASQRRPAAPPSGAAAIAGRRLFADHCAGCHAIAGRGGRSGPDLTHLASRRAFAAGTLPLDRTRLAAWMLDPQRYKPGAHMPKASLQLQEVDQIADYLMELR